MTEENFKPAKYQTKPTPVETVQLLDDTHPYVDRYHQLNTVATWVNSNGGRADFHPVNTALMLTNHDSDGRVHSDRADAGDWVVRDADGWFTGCNPDAFAATYEPAGGES